ncbi:chemotaxis protein CheW [Natrinema salifodinae]|uniref:CheW-like domain-containing protein n=1 Tax=Natrinema salifodinae TaxID=1202768 RepID=A0A1I0N8P5_9EURY|nr:chemotaxis protein CheW [Natrinema salifodinae]SEV97342.1 CheW-like domain-containing protein [Natrinema salifodinae]
MAPDLSEKLLGIDTDDPDRNRNSGGEEGKQEDLVRFVFAAVGEHRLALPVDAVRTITEPADELTRVPRAPSAIEGLMDLRGEITAVIDPSVHFPVSESRSKRERLLVLDRPNDQQSAAIRVDTVLSVETVPERNVIDDASDHDDLSGDALDHPLVAALVTQERKRKQGRDPRADADSVVTDEPESNSVTGGEFGAGTRGSAGLSSTRGAGGAAGSSGDSIGEAFEIEPIEDDDAQPDETETDDSPTELVVDATAVVDVDRLLLAVGQA